MKYFKHKFLFYIVGVVGIFALIFGIMVAVLPTVFTTVISVATICFSVAAGLIFINPFFAIGIAVGILMLIIPKLALTIVFSLFGVFICVTNVIFYLKAQK